MAALDHMKAVGDCLVEDGMFSMRERKFLSLGRVMLIIIILLGEFWLWRLRHWRGIWVVERRLGPSSPPFMMEIMRSVWGCQNAVTARFTACLTGVDDLFKIGA